jgi:hypothetical protein
MIALSGVFTLPPTDLLVSSADMRGHCIRARGRGGINLVYFFRRKESFDIIRARRDEQAIKNELQ